MQRRNAVFPGTFDPITLGHLDIINRASTMVDQLVVAVFTSEGKCPAFSVRERALMAQKAITCKNVVVEVFDGLLVDFIAKHDLRIVVRGIRTPADCERELRMWIVNKKLDARVETIWLPASENHQYISSSLVREIACLGGNVEPFVPGNVVEACERYYMKKRQGNGVS